MDLIEISGTIVISFRIFFYTFFSIKDSKYFEFESNSLYRVEFIKNFKDNNCFHRKFFFTTAIRKTLTFKKFFPSLRSKIRKISNLVLFFYISSNILKISKIIIIPVQKNCFHQRFNKMTLPFIRFSYLSFHREKTIHSLVETYSLSNLFRLPVDSH